MDKLNEKYLWAVTALAMALCAFFFYSAVRYSSDAQLEQEKLDALNLKAAQYKKLEEFYGGDKTSDYYAVRPIVILDTEGEEKQVDIYWNTQGKQPPEGKGLTSAIDTVSHDDVFTVKWGPFFDEGTHLSYVAVTPGKNVGWYPLTFSNNVDDRTFQLLIVVK